MTEEKPFLAASMVKAYTELLQQQLQASVILNAGLPKISDEERAERKAEREAAKTRVAAALAAVTEPAVRAILDHHRDTGYECWGCDAGEYGAQWPCSTIDTLAPFIGVSESDLKLI